MQRQKIQTSLHVRYRAETVLLKPAGAQGAQELLGSQGSLGVLVSYF